MDDEIFEDINTVATGENERWVIFLDPGKDTGWARFSLNTARLKGRGILRGPERVTPWLMLQCEPELFPELIVYEDYRIRNSAVNEGRMNRAMQKGHEDPLKVIGMIESFCTIKGIKIESVSPRDKEPGYGIGGIKKLPKHKHKDSHDRDAMAHGINWLSKKGIYKPVRPDFDPKTFKM